MDDLNPEEQQFVTDEVSNIMKEGIEGVIAGAAYQHNKVNQWTSNVVEQCLNQLTKLGKPFKYIVTCVIMQKNGAGLHTASSCFWDTQTDGHCTVRWENKSMPSNSWLLPANSWKDFTQPPDASDETVSSPAPPPVPTVTTDEPLDCSPYYLHLQLISIMLPIIKHHQENPSPIQPVPWFIAGSLGGGPGENGRWRYETVGGGGGGSGGSGSGNGDENESFELDSVVTQWNCFLVFSAANVPFECLREIAQEIPRLSSFAESPPSKSEVDSCRPQSVFMYPQEGQTWKEFCDKLLYIVQTKFPENHPCNSMPRKADPGRLRTEQQIEAGWSISSFFFIVVGAVSIITVVFAIYKSRQLMKSGRPPVTSPALIRSKSQFDSSRNDDGV